MTASPVPKRTGWLAADLTARQLLVAVGLGLLSAACFYPLSLGPLVLVSISCLLVLLRDAPPAQARVLGLVYGAVYGAGTLYWFFGIFSLQAVPLIALFAGYHWLLAALVASTRGMPAFRRACLVALFAVAVDWLRGDAWYLRFPWYTVPHALAGYPAWIAGTRWLGTYGLTFVAWLIAGLGAFGSWRWWAAFVLLPGAAFLLPGFDAPDRRALLVQGETTVDLEQVIRALPLRATHGPIGRVDLPVDLAVLPEYAYTTSINEALARQYGPSLLARKTSSPVVFGAVAGEIGTTNFENVAAVIVADGQVLQLRGTFTKQRPIPLFLDGRAGSERPVFPLDQGTLGVAICFDYDAPEIAATLVWNGASVLVNPTFDKESWGRNQHEHHEWLLRLRAVENDRWVLRAASSGRTEAIDPHGRPSVEGVDIGAAGAVVVPFAHRHTYTLGGALYVLGPAAMLGTLVYMLVSAWRLLQPSRQHVEAPAFEALDGTSGG